jgi:hypothetical protein
MYECVGVESYPEIRVVGRGGWETYKVPVEFLDVFAMVSFAC